MSDMLVNIPPVVMRCVVVTALEDIYSHSDSWWDALLYLLSGYGVICLILEWIFYVTTKPILFDEDTSGAHDNRPPIEEKASAFRFWLWTWNYPIARVSVPVVVQCLSYVIHVVMGVYDAVIGISTRTVDTIVKGTTTVKVVVSNVSTALIVILVSVVAVDCFLGHQARQGNGQVPWSLRTWFNARSDPQTVPVRSVIEWCIATFMTLWTGAPVAYIYDFLKIVWAMKRDMVGE